MGDFIIFGFDFLLGGVDLWYRGIYKRREFVEEVYYDFERDLFEVEFERV